MNKFKLKSDFRPTADQKNAINKLSAGIKNDINYQVLLGVTGSGKTFTIANLIEKLQRPALIISHNKTLAAQLYQEFKYFFPKNAVSYFVSYYDFYQPEAYIPQTDTYIEKDSDINELIDKLRLSATTNLMTRPDCIVVASVSCIYNIGSPEEYSHFTYKFTKDVKIERSEIVNKLIDLQYERGDFGFHRGTFRLRGNLIDIYPAYQDEAVRIELEENIIKSIYLINPLSGSKMENRKLNYRPNKDGGCFCTNCSRS
jgi:excinuclease ABC subunit B